MRWDRGILITIHFLADPVGPWVWAIRPFLCHMEVSVGVPNGRMVYDGHIYIYNPIIYIYIYERRWSANHFRCSGKKMDRSAEISKNWVTAGLNSSATLREANVHHFRILDISGFKTYRPSKPLILSLLLQSSRRFATWLRACARVTVEKAVGLDQIPPEARRQHVQQMVRLTYSQLLKIALHGQESIHHKGGRLTAAFKGKGSAQDCSTYRSISSQIGKCLHRTLRSFQASLYESYLQRQQLGGRKGIPVQSECISSEPLRGCNAHKTGHAASSSWISKKPFIVSYAPWRYTGPMAGLWHSWCCTASWAAIRHPLGSTCSPSWSLCGTTSKPYHDTYNNVSQPSTLTHGLWWKDKSPMSVVRQPAVAQAIVSQTLYLDICGQESCGP